MKFELQSWQIEGFVKNSSLLFIPEYQREGEVWTPRKKKLFIDTIIKGWRIPKIYLNNPDGSKEYEIVDGQQRIHTILDFVAGDFKIEKEDGSKVSFEKLDSSIQQNILNYKIDVEVIHEATDDEVSELFSRLQEGVGLNSAEKLNAISSALTLFVNQTESHPFFDKANFRKKRYGLKNICQQITFLEAEGIGPAKYPDLRDFFYDNPDISDETKMHITSTLDFMNRIFSQETDYLSKAGNVTTVYLICSWILKGEKEDRYRDVSNLNKFFSQFFLDYETKYSIDKDFISYNLALLQSTSGGESIRSRYKIMKKHLYLYEPGYCLFLTADELSDFSSSVDQSIVEKVEKIHLLMQEINERAIGLGRNIVFDITSESSQVFLILQHRIKNVKGYETFIDLLWKAFYEGSHSANNIGTLDNDRNHTKPLKDLNILIKIDDLRKIDAHDLEHDRNTYQQKVKIACDLWKLYVSKRHINDFNENDFVIFQYKIIQELLDFLLTYRDQLRSSV